MQRINFKNREEKQKRVDNILPFFRMFTKMETDA